MIRLRRPRWCASVLTTTESVDPLDIRSPISNRLPINDSQAATDPRVERRALKRAAIVARAWDLARRDGLGGLTLHGLAAAVGLRQPSLYVYFDSKLALYDALFADGYRQMLEFTRERNYDGEPRAAL